MGQVNDRRYDVDGITFGKLSIDAKKKKLVFNVKVDSINLNDGMLLILLHDRPLFAAFEYDDKKVKVGDCSLFRWGGEAQHGTSAYSFDMNAIDWLPTKYEMSEWSDDKRMKLIIIDKAVEPIVAVEQREQLDREVQNSLFENDEEDTEEDNDDDEL